MSCNFCKINIAAEDVRRSHLMGRKHSRNTPSKLLIKGFGEGSNRKSIGGFLQKFGKIKNIQFIDKNASVYVSYCDNRTVFNVAHMPLNYMGRILTVSWETNENGAPSSRMLVNYRVREGNGFNEQLDILQREIQPDRQMMNVKCQMVCGDVKNLLNVPFPECNVHLFGSNAMGLQSTESDIDIYIEGVNSNQPMELNTLKHIRGLLLKSGLFSKCHLIAKAKVPIIHFCHYKTNLKGDLNIRNMLCVQNTKLLAYYLGFDPKLKMLIMALKYMTSSKQGPNGMKKLVFHGLTSYALVNMMIFYLQQEPFRFPTVEELQTKESEFIQGGWNCGFAENDYEPNEAFKNTLVFDLFRGFFDFYANQNYEGRAICPYLGQSLKRNVFVDVDELPDKYVMYKNNAAQTSFINVNTPIVVQDPFEHNCNITSNMPKQSFHHFIGSCNLIVSKAKQTDSFFTILEEFENLSFHSNNYIEMREGFNVFEVLLPYDVENKEKEVAKLWFAEIKKSLEIIMGKVLSCNVVKYVDEETESGILVSYSAKSLWDIWHQRSKFRRNVKNFECLSIDEEVSATDRLLQAFKKPMRVLMEFILKSTHSTNVYLGVHFSHISKVDSMVIAEKLFVEQCVKFMLNYLNMGIYSAICSQSEILNKVMKFDEDITVKTEVLDTSANTDCYEMANDEKDILTNSLCEYPSTSYQSEIAQTHDNLQIRNDFYKIGFAQPSIADTSNPHETSDLENKGNYNQIESIAETYKSHEDIFTIGTSHAIDQQLTEQHNLESSNQNVTMQRNDLYKIGFAAPLKTDNPSQISKKKRKKKNKALKNRNLHTINVKNLQSLTNISGIDKTSMETFNLNVACVQNSDIAPDGKFSLSNNDNTNPAISNEEHQLNLHFDNNATEINTSQSSEQHQNFEEFNIKISVINANENELMDEDVRSGSLHTENMENNEIYSTVHNSTSRKMPSSSTRHGEAKAKDDNTITNNEAIEEEEDIPPDFFDDFSNQDFMAGLDIVDVWDEEEKKPSGEEQLDEEPASLETKRSKSSDKVGSRSKSPKRRRLKSPEVRRRSGSYQRGTKSPRMEMRRDPEKTRRDISRDKLRCAKDKEQKIVSDKLKIVETGLVPPGTEMDVDLESISKLTKSTLIRESSPIRKSPIRKSPLRKSPIRYEEHKRYRRSNSRELRRRLARSPQYYRSRRDRERRRRSSSSDQDREWMRKSKKRSRSRGSPISRSKSHKQELTKKKSFLEEIRDKLNETNRVTSSIPTPSNYNMYQNVIPAPVPAPAHFIPHNTGGVQQYDQQFFIGDTYTGRTSWNDQQHPIQYPVGPVQPPQPISQPIVTPVQMPVVSLQKETERQKKKAVDASNIDKLFADKKISLSDFLSITAKSEVNSSSPEYLQKKINVISRCQEAIKALTEEKTFSGRLIVKTMADNRPKQEVKYQSPLRRIPVVRFHYTTPQRANEEADPFLATLDKVLKRVGIRRSAPRDDVMDTARPVSGSSFADEASCLLSKFSPKRFNNLSMERAGCDECKKRNALVFSEVGTQCVDRKQTFNVATQVNEDEFNHMKGKKNDSIAYLTPAQLLGKERSKEDDSKTTPTKDCLGEMKKTPEEALKGANEERRLYRTPVRNLDGSRELFDRSRGGFGVSRDPRVYMDPRFGSPGRMHVDDTSATNARINEPNGYNPRNPNTGRFGYRY